MAFRSLGLAAALAAGLWTVTTAALAENRVALVIGNSSYQSVPALTNPANDAAAMVDLLRSAGFDVISAPDLTQANMRRTIGEFTDKVAAKGPDTVALVYYAGHGLQVDGDNYLVPVDARIQRESDVPLQATRLTDLMNALAAVPSKARIVMLDACRNNPFSEINKVTGRGLAIVDAPRGSLVSYSTAPGTEALDGDGLNSPYTAAVLKIAKEPALPIEQMFKRVRYAVNEATRSQTRSASGDAVQPSSETLMQTPWESSSLTVDFSFFPDADGSSTPPANARTGTGQPAAGRANVPTRSTELWKRELARKPAREAYEIVVKEDAVEAYQAYLALFGTQPDARNVRTLVERRQVMVAWYVARTADTPTAYQTFLASYASSDFANTAQTLLGRSQTRSLAGGTTTLANVCPCALPAQPTQQLQKKANTKSKNSNRRSRRNDDDDQPAQRVVTSPGNPVVVGPATPIILSPRPSFGIGLGGGGGGGGRPSGGMSTPQTKPMGNTGRGGHF